MKGNDFIKHQQNFSGALKCYNKSIELNPNDAASFANRSLVHFKLENYAKAIEDATEAMKLKPPYLKALHRRGKAYHALSEYEKATRDFESILKVEPNNQEVKKDLTETQREIYEKI